MLISLLKKLKFYFGIGFGIFVGLGVYFLFSSDPYLPKTPEQHIQIIILSIILAFAGFLYPYAVGKRKRKGSNNAYIGKVTRRPFSEEQKANARRRQNGMCLRCDHYPAVWEYHHRDGNRSNDHTSNCEAICPTCHAKIERGLA